MSLKTGCLFLLFLWAALSGAYFYLLQGTELEMQYWLPVVLALSVVIAIANFQGILLAISQKRASKKSPHEWRDGELIGISGQVKALRAPVIAPFSGKPCVILEYEISRTTGTGKNRTNSIDFTGMLMAPCAVHTSRGPVRLVGFPLIPQTSHERIENPADLGRAGKYLATTQFKERTKNPLALLKELNEILADDDGDLKADFRNPGAFPTELEDDYDDDLDESAKPPIASVAERPDELNARANLISARLSDESYTLTETLIPNGAELTVFGTYLAGRKVINIGSGLKNLKHQIHLGAIDSVLAKQFRRAIVWTLLFGTASLAAHWYVGKLLGYPVDELLQSATQYF